MSPVVSSKELSGVSQDFFLFHPSHEIRRFRYSCHWHHLDKMSESLRSQQQQKNQEAKNWTKAVFKEQNVL